MNEQCSRIDIIRSIDRIHGLLFTCIIYKEIQCKEYHAEVIKDLKYLLELLAIFMSNCQTIKIRK